MGSKEKIKEKAKTKVFYSYGTDEPETNNFDDDEPASVEEIDEEDQTNKERSQQERGDYSFETPYVSSRKIQYEILKTNNGYKIITYLNSKTIAEDIQEYLDSFPICVNITKERLEEIFITKRNNKTGFKIDKNLNSYHNIMLPNGEVIPLVNLVRSGGGPTPRRIKKYWEYRSRFSNTSIKQKFDQVENYFDSDTIEKIEKSGNIEKETILHILNNIFSNHSSISYKDFKEFIEKNLEESDLIKSELKEIFYYVKERKKWFI